MAELNDPVADTPIETVELVESKAVKAGPLDGLGSCLSNVLAEDTKDYDAVIFQLVKQFVQQFADKFPSDTTISGILAKITLIDGDNMPQVIMRKYVVSSIKQHILANKEAILHKKREFITKGGYKTIPQLSKLPLNKIWKKLAEHEKEGVWGALKLLVDEVSMAELVNSTQYKGAKRMASQMLANVGGVPKDAAGNPDLSQVDVGKLFQNMGFDESRQREMIELASDFLPSLGIKDLNLKDMLAGAENENKTAEENDKSTRDVANLVSQLGGKLQEAIRDPKVAMNMFENMTPAKRQEMIKSTQKLYTGVKLPAGIPK